MLPRLRDLALRTAKAAPTYLIEEIGLVILSKNRDPHFMIWTLPLAMLPQVADRWRLLNKLFDTLTRSLERHRGTLAQVAHRRSRKSATDSGQDVQQPRPTQVLLRKQEGRERRLQRFEDLRDLLDNGMNHSEAARQLGMPVRTVQRRLTYGFSPGAQAPILFEHSRSIYGSHLERRYREGCRHIKTLWQEARP